MYVDIYILHVYGSKKKINSVVYNFVTVGTL